MFILDQSGRLALKEGLIPIPEFVAQLKFAQEVSDHLNIFLKEMLVFLTRPGVYGRRTITHSDGKYSCSLTVMTHTDDESLVILRLFNCMSTNRLINIMQGFELSCGTRTIGSVYLDGHNDWEMVNTLQWSMPIKDGSSVLLVPASS